MRLKASIFRGKNQNGCGTFESDVDSLFRDPLQDDGVCWRFIIVSSALYLDCYIWNARQYHSLKIPSAVRAWILWGCRWDPQHQTVTAYLYKTISACILWRWNQIFADLSLLVQNFDEWRILRGTRLQPRIYLLWWCDGIQKALFQEWILLLKHYDPGMIQTRERDDVDKTEETINSGCNPCTVSGHIFMYLRSWSTTHQSVHPCGWFFCRFKMSISVLWCEKREIERKMQKVNWKCNTRAESFGEGLVCSDSDV